jgi:hypothetical protein
MIRISESGFWVGGSGFLPSLTGENQSINQSPPRKEKMIVTAKANQPMLILLFLLSEVVFFLISAGSRCPSKPFKFPLTDLSLPSWPRLAGVL